eukprot:Tbor_TRINITY_DN5881_c0_g1::TRINITY_DN5881_c0_g1_i1::g.5988::m.5988
MLHNLIEKSKVTSPCRVDLRRLGREYDDDAEPLRSQTRAAAARSKRFLPATVIRPAEAKKQLNDSIGCKTVLRSVPNGNYIASARHHRAVTDLYASTINQNSTKGGESSVQKLPLLSNYHTWRNMSNPADNNQLVLYDSSSQINKARDTLMSMSSNEQLSPRGRYAEAYRRHTGKNPTEAELDDAERLQFGLSSATEKYGILDSRDMSSFPQSLNGLFYYMKRNCIHCGGSGSIKLNPRRCPTLDNINPEVSCFKCDKNRYPPFRDTQTKASVVKF